MNLVDPLDRAVAKAWNRPPQHQTAGARVLEQAMSREAGVDPLREDVAEIIYGFDQEAIEQRWSRLGAGRRQTYYDIAAAVIARVRKG